MTLDAPLEVRKPHRVIDVSTSDCGSIAVRRYGDPNGPRIVVSHGNGLATDAYYPFWSLLEDRFDLLVYDLRNHGWNPLGSLENHNVYEFMEDNDRVFEAIDRHFGRKPKIGVFHSISALTALLNELRSPAFSALVLFDPPLYLSGMSLAEYDAASILACKAIRRRASRFESIEQFVELLSYSPSHRRISLGIRNLLATATLRAATEGSGFELRCPPAYEAQAIDHVSAWAVLVDLPAVSCPTKVIGADPTLQYAYLPTFDLSEITDVDYDFFPEVSHFLQLERPRDCVTLMMEFLGVNGLLSG